MAINWENITKGAGTGAGVGSAFGPWGALAGAGVGALSGLFGRENKETKMQKTQRHLVDQLLGSINDQGPYSNMFNVDEETFQKSFVDPMKHKFQSQIAPQIQQNYIASGQHRSSAMEDDLTRAGVDMDQLLNQAYGQMQENAMNRNFQSQQNAFNRQSNVFGGVLGFGPGAPNTPTALQAMGQGAAGYLTSDKFGQNLDDILKYFQGTQGGIGNTSGYTANNPYNTNTGFDMGRFSGIRKGFES